MNIVWLTSEAAPYAKTGGLADVSAALPKALAARGNQVTVIMPYYKRRMGAFAGKLTSEERGLGVPAGNGEKWCGVRQHKINDNLRFVFIEYDAYFDRDGLYDWYGYGYHDNAERFLFFSRACMQAILALGIKPDILHTNDWHTAIACVYLRSPLYRDLPAFADCRSTLTIHNIGYQGVCHKSLVGFSGLGWEFFHVHCLEFYDQLNPLKGGVMTADMVNTVSPTYAAEILSPEFAFALDHPLQHQAALGRLRGILNGIDVDEWSPETDKLLPANYSIDEMGGKADCKEALQREFLLPVKRRTPVIAIISRLAIQKGIDVFAAAVGPMLRDDNCQFVVVGTGERHLEEHLNYLASIYPDKIGVYIGYASDRVAHLVEAGADMFLMPSRYEPCGLNQMYSMRYGTVPIVRATGGLEDTVENFGPFSEEQATGFKFWDLSPEAVVGTCRWATDTYRNHPDKFAQIRRNGMGKDFSWQKTAGEYERLYHDIRR